MSSDEQRWCLAVGGGSEVTAHWNTIGITVTGKVTAVQILFNIVKASKHPHAHAGPGGGKDFLAFHRIPQCLPRIVAGPHAGQTSRQRLFMGVVIGGGIGGSNAR